MTFYGGAACSFPGCDCVRLELLDLHHVGGGGNEHRRSIKMEGGGYAFYQWIKRNGYPSGYAVYCPLHHREVELDLKAAKKGGSQ